MELTRAIADALIAQERAIAAREMDVVRQRQKDGESGVVAGALAIFGAGHDSQLDAQVGAVRMVQASIDRWAALVDDVIANGTGDKWLDTGRVIETQLKGIDAASVEATIDDTLKKTAAKTATDVKEGATKIAGTVLSFVPWWAWVGLVGGVGLALAIRFGRRPAAA